MLEGTIIETPEPEEDQLSLLAATEATPSLTITGISGTSVTLNAVFPKLGASGNTFELWDFNQGGTVYTWQYDIDKNGSQSNNWNEKSKSYSISKLVSGGMYYIGLCWSTDGGKSSGGSNKVLRRIQLLPTTDQAMTLTEGSYVTANIETDDKGIPTSTNFKKWIGRMDDVYLRLKDLTGFIPYNGKKIQLKSTRQDMNTNNPDGEDYWIKTNGWSGNPALIARAHYRGLMLRLTNGDWGDVTIHEMSHDFDMDEWSFDPEVLADLKLSYIIQTLTGATIYRDDTDKYYSSSDIYDFFYTDQMDSYQHSFAKGWYHSRGMTAVMLKIKDTIGWDAFKKTFRYMADLDSDEYSYIYSSSTRNEAMGKFNIFITKLRDYSKQDVISKLTASEKNIIESKYGGTISYYVAPPPVIGGGGGRGGKSTVNLPAGEYMVRRFIPETSGSYSIYTSPFGGTGVSNDTVIEVYSDETLVNKIGSNDDYGDTRFSKVNVSLSAYQTYYIKLRHFNTASEIYADLKIRKNITSVALTVNTPVNTQVAALEYSAFSFTPSTSGQYVFTTGQYNGTTQTTNKDMILGLYRNEALTDRMIASQYTAGKFPEVSAELTAGVNILFNFYGIPKQSSQSPNYGYTAINNNQRNQRSKL